MAASVVLRSSMPSNLHAAFATALSDISSYDEAKEKNDGMVLSVNELEAMVDTLRDAYLKVQSALLRKSNALKPINLIPQEVLTEIFRYTDTRSTFRASWICHNWRSAALNNPRLWNVMDFMSLGSINYDENRRNMLSLMAERSAAVPLILNFYLQRDGTNFYNYYPPYNEDTLDRAGVIYNIATSALPQYKRAFPLLDTLHVGISIGYPFEDYIDCPPLLRHLSIEVAGKPLPPANKITKELQTLHLIGVPDTPFEALGLVSNFPDLEELVITGYTGTMDPVVDQGTRPGEAYILPPLRTLTLTNLTPHFLVGFLKNSVVHSSTSVNIDPIPMGGEMRAQEFYRPEDTTSVWADFSNRTIVCKHAEALSQFTWPEEAIPNISLTFPPFVRLRTAQSLVIKNIMPGYSFNLAPFAGLERLTFNHSPGVHETEWTKLSSILNDTLGTNCPKLAYIGLRLELPNLPVMGYGEDATVDPDEAEQVIPEFLAKWNTCMGKKFGTMRIEDKINPSRWDDLIPDLTKAAESFELGEVVLEEAIPSLPQRRAFEL